MDLLVVGFIAGIAGVTIGIILIVLGFIGLSRDGDRAWGLTISAGLCMILLIAIIGIPEFLKSAVLEQMEEPSTIVSSERTGTDNYETVVKTKEGVFAVSYSKSNYDKYHDKVGTEENLPILERQDKYANTSDSFVIAPDRNDNGNQRDQGDNTGEENKFSGD